MTVSAPAFRLTALGKLLSLRGVFLNPKLIMSLRERHRVVSRQLSSAPLSNRTLHHPSFQSLYMISGFDHQQSCNQTVHPIITPAELFYTDPTMNCGRRIPNLVSDLEVLDCFQLNTPQPRMSACLAPPVRPDPFRTRPHPITDLGSLTLRLDGFDPLAQANLLVVQLTQEEDDTVTNLLKLHHQEPAAFKPPPHHDERRYWSESELEAAKTLLNGFNLMKDDEMLEGSDKKSAESPDLPEGSKTVPEFSSPACSQSCISLCDAENENYGNFLSKGRKSVAKYLLSDSEGDAITVLLSLRDTPIS